MTDKRNFCIYFWWFYHHFFSNFLFPSDNGNYLSMIPIHSSVASSTAMLTQNTLTEQACKCHGHPIDLVTPNKAKWTCPITNRQLAASDVTATAVRIGEQTVFSAYFGR
jgi:hypothetical protein